MNLLFCFVVLGVVFLVTYSLYFGVLETFHLFDKSVPFFNVVVVVFNRKTSSFVFIYPMVTPLPFSKQTDLSIDFPGNDYQVTVCNTSYRTHCA